VFSASRTISLSPETDDIVPVIGTLLGKSTLFGPEDVSNDT